jgi:hypothetical protein
VIQAGEVSAFPLHKQVVDWLGLPNFNPIKSLGKLQNPIYGLVDMPQFGQALSCSEAVLVAGLGGSFKLCRHVYKEIRPAEGLKVELSSDPAHIQYAETCRGG